MFALVGDKTAPVGNSCGLTADYSANTWFDVPHSEPSKLISLSLPEDTEINFVVQTAWISRKSVFTCARYRLCYGNVAGWQAGCHTPVFYQNG